ncbi:MAG TPA: hypothetical protein VEA69_12570 [Tepidisphaeraceae bacterium]|nr:hypothetical protein [Tepidisphaeraceae bacterium]
MGFRKRFSTSAMAFLLIASCPLAADDPKPKPADAPAAAPAAKPVTFSAVLYTPETRLGRGLGFAAAYGDFTLDGPRVDTLKPLPDGARHAVIDPATKRLFALAWPSPREVDLAKGTATPLPKPPANLPELSHPCAVAYDTKRDHLVVATLGGKGELYAFAPKTATWTHLAGLNNADLAALTYDPQADKLYGLFRQFGDPTTVQIRTYAPDGTPGDTFEFNDPQLAKQLQDHPVAGRYPVDLAVVGDRLALITPDGIYAIHLKARTIRLTWSRKAQPA